MNLLLNVEATLVQRCKFEVAVSTLRRRCEFDFVISMLQQRCQTTFIIYRQLNLLSNVEGMLEQRYVDVVS